MSIEYHFVNRRSVNMSIEYHFVNRERKEQVRHLKELVEAERSALLEKLSQFAKDNPLAEGNVEDIVFAVRQGIGSACFQADSDDEGIGMATAAKFYWRQDNGFQSLADVERFLKEHPGYAIENDYGDELSFLDFSESIRKLPSSPLF